MKKQLLRDLAELEHASVITPDIATSIKQYYTQKEVNSGNRLLTVFGVLGACLVGLGIILIIAHNWDDLGRLLKTTLAFSLLVTGQLIAVYVILKKRDSVAWRESAATFLFFAIGACISLVSQIYHIPGNLSSFLLTWSLLGLPVVYLLHSSMVSLLYVGGITWFVCETEYWSHGLVSGHFYWLLLAGIIPYYINLLRTPSEGNFAIFHNWFVVLSVTISLGIFGKSEEQWLFPAYMSLFGIFNVLGQFLLFTSIKRRTNAFLIIGSLGTLVLLLITSFDGVWVDIFGEERALSYSVSSPEFIVFTALTAGAMFLLVRKYQLKKQLLGNPMEIVFVVFAVLFLIGHFTAIIPLVLVNLVILMIGLYYISYGTRENHLGLLNYGLLILTALVVCRFFDADISFVLRGLLFITVGIGFFVANLRMLKKRKNHG
ncbi:MAG: DUF2157 domain-containing protein [Marinilabiliaceae bacterium]|nr:DUF2157 domain-containing protein [Marinilabiliaceae bacterium]